MIDQYPPSNGVLTSLIWRKTMSGGETSLSGYDNASQALSYTPGQEQVYLNGILLVRGDDYTATNGTSITGLAALSASDFVQINCYNNFSVASVPATSITGEVTNSQITSLATSKLTGTIANNQLANSAITINGTSTSLGGTYTNSSASTSTAGIVQLTDSTSSTSTTTAATPNSVKSAYDLANGAIPKSLTTTTGDIIYASAANTPARLGIGSTSQVLTVSGGIPTWASASSGGMTLLSENNLSGVQDLQLTNLFTGSYKQILIVGRNLVSTPNDAFVQIRVREASGTIDSRYRGTSSDGSTVTGFGVNGDSYLTMARTGQNDNYSLFFKWLFYQPIGEAYFHSEWVSTSGAYNLAINSVNDHQQGIPDNVNIKNSLGNFSRGTIYVYGIK